MNLLNEIIVDNFAGGGGASTGIELAAGRPVTIAVNHDPDAILMHKTNHPYTEHFQASVWDIDPVAACRGRPVGLAWFSPDCKHFSKAKGGTPVDKNIRGLAWVAVRWASEVKPRVIILENVEEFQTWGPLKALRDSKTGRVIKIEEYVNEDGELDKKMVVAKRGEVIPFPQQIMVPDKTKSGQTFKQFTTALKNLGYEIDYRELVAADYGAPTIRKRFFLIARCDGKPIVWPETTHAPADSDEVGEGRKLPWRSAAEIIDWTIPCPSIFDTKAQIKAKYNKTAVRPLADNTMRRVARGLDKFVIKSAKPFIVQVNHSGDFRGQDTAEPLQTITGKHGYGVVSPSIAPFHMHNHENAAGTDICDPLNTITSTGSQILVTPCMMAICQTGGGDRIRSVTDPVNTTVSKAESCLIAPALIQYHTEQSEKVRGQTVNDPIMTVDASNRYGVASAFLTEYYGNAQDGINITGPMHTQTAKDREGVTLAYMSKYFGGVDGAPLSEPTPTVTAVDHNALTAAHIVKFKGQDLGQHPETPLHTITTSAGEFGAVNTYLIKSVPGARLHRWPQVRDMLNTYCGYTIAEDEVLILNINGYEYFIADIGLRMLEARELYSANGFPPDYIIDRDFMGNAYGKTKQVARCGNAVPPPFATALVRANLPEWCDKEITTMEELERMIAV